MNNTLVFFIIIIPTKTSTSVPFLLLGPPSRRPDPHPHFVFLKGCSFFLSCPHSTGFQCHMLMLPHTLDPRCFGEDFHEGCCF